VNEIGELAKHIRTIHFTIILVIFVLIEATALRKQNLFKTPEELEQLETVFRHGPDHLRDWVDEHVAQYLRQGKIPEESLHRGRPVFLLTHGQGQSRHFYRLLYLSAWVYKSQRSFIVGSGFLDFPPNRLRNFRDWWDENQESLVFLVPRLDNNNVSAELMGASGKPSHPRLTYDLPPPGAIVEDVSLAVMASARESLELSPPPGVSPPLTIRVSHLLGTGITLQRAIIAAADYKWRSGVFSDSFPKIAKDFDLYADRSYDYGPVAKDLKGDEKSGSRQQDRTEEKEQRLNLFGNALMVQDVWRFGSLALVGLQAYVCLILSELLRLMKLQQATSVNWIGVYSSMPAKVFVGLSLFVGPTIMIGIVELITFRSDTLRSAGIIVLTGCLALSLVFGVWSAFLGTRIWANMSTTPSDAVATAATWW
jgi:hypothetical protein